MTSYHIQDLRLLLSTHGFELHVNKHCAKIDPSFREWLQELPRGDLSRTEELSNNRFDLLCSLCFPTIDPPQLLRVSKSCALTFLASDGLIEVGDLLSHPLTRSSTPHPDLLNPEDLLAVGRSIRTRQIQEWQYSPRAPSGTNVLRFASNLFSLFYPPQEMNAQNSHLGLLEFLAVLESAYDRRFSEELTNIALLANLWRRTTKIIMWSQDLASYRSRHSYECNRCTICCSMEGRGLTLQAAVNDIRQCLQTEVGNFVRDRGSLNARICDNEDAATVADAMRDCITGFIHWLYEGERYFGKHYEEVAKFGWVFMDTGGASTTGDEADVQ